MCLRLTLMPLSLMQAKSIRTNYVVWLEAKKAIEARGSAAEDRPAAKLQRTHDTLTKFHELRRLSDAPHPAWMIVNPLVQVRRHLRCSALCDRVFELALFLTRFCCFRRPP